MVVVVPLVNIACKHGVLELRKPALLVHSSSTPVATAKAFYLVVPFWKHASSSSNHCIQCRYQSDNNLDPSVLSVRSERLEAAEACAHQVGDFVKCVETFLPVLEV